MIEKRQRQEEKILRSLKKRKQETNKKINVTRTKLITQDFSHLTAKVRFHIRYFCHNFFRNILFAIFYNCVIRTDTL